MYTSWKQKDVWMGFDYIPLVSIRGSLYLGAWESDEEEIQLIEELKKRKIDLIVGLGFRVHPIRRFSILSHVKTISCDIEDYPDLNSANGMSQFLATNLGAIHAALMSGENVYIHCHAGISRSPTVVIAYLMRYHDRTLKEAMDYVQQFRPQIYPNPVFRRLLESREETHKMIQAGRTAQGAQAQKT